MQGCHNFSFCLCLRPKKSSVCIVQLIILFANKYISQLKMKTTKQKNKLDVGLLAEN